MGRAWLFWHGAGVRVLTASVAVWGGLLSGCAHRRCWTVAECAPEYWQVVLTDFEGRRISEYIAEGELTETCNGVCFWALQRRIFQPVVLTFRYPLGRPVKVEGSHIIMTRICRPF